MLTVRNKSEGKAFGNFDPDTCSIRVLGLESAKAVAACLEEMGIPVNQIGNVGGTQTVIVKQGYGDVSGDWETIYGGMNGSTVREVKVTESKIV